MNKFFTLACFAIVSVAARPTTEALFARANARKIERLATLEDLHRNIRAQGAGAASLRSSNGQSDMTLDELEELAVHPNLLGKKIYGIHQNSKYLLKRANELTTIHSIKGESDMTLDELERLAAHPNLLTDPRKF